MMHTSRTSLLLLALAPLTTVTAKAAEPGRLNLFGRHFSIVAGAKVYTPDTAETRGLYGSHHVFPDIRLWHFDSRKGAAFAYDLGFTRFEKEPLSADFISTGVGVHVVLANPDNAVVPYWILRGGPYFPKISGHGRSTTVGGNTELGLSIASRLVVAARYDMMGKAHGVRLSGYTGRVGIRLF
jgi:hypothetical protein